MPRESKQALVSLLAVTCAALSSSAVANDGYYKGKQVTLIIGVNPGGGYDLYARLLGRHWGRHLPGNPTVVPRNMHGAGSKIAAQHLYNVAPKDGTTVGAVVNGLPFEPIFSDEKVTGFDPVKFAWIGNINKEVNLLVVSDKSGVTSFDQLLKGHELIVASSGGAGSANTMPRILNSVLGTKMKVIAGYKSSADGFLAMERGEVHGRGMYWSSLMATQREGYESGKLKILLQIGIEGHSEIKGVPLVLDMAKTEDDRKLMEVLFASLTIGRPVLAPPGMPPERVEMLRKSFDAVVADADLHADARKQRMEVVPMTGLAVEAMINKIYQSHPAILARAKSMWK